MGSTDFAIDSQDIRFVVREWLHAEQLSQHSRFEAFDADTLDLMLQESEKFSAEVLFPTRTETDREGCRVEDGRVRMPKCLTKPYQQSYKLGWGSLCSDPDYGGQGAPVTLGLAVSEATVAGNQAITSFFALTSGAARLILSFGAQDLKDRYVPHLLSGRFNGTMCLSEAHAGSDVGAALTSAVPLGDGSYRIKGTKSWISNGDADLVENTIHAVLARVEGAPAGTKGLTLFAVPRVHVKDDGSLGDSNDVDVPSIESKMGLHGSPTCVVKFGENDGCIGWPLGGEGQGMPCMFQMMNEARIGTATIGLGIGSLAAQNTTAYAKERVQGPHITKMRDPDTPRVPIIEHPAVRFNLLQMRARVEAMRALMFKATFLLDEISVTDDPEMQASKQNLVDLLTPMCKGWCTEVGLEVVQTGIQVLGGVGYTKDFPMEQLYRDLRVAPIYEGTTDIQALDLVGRKMMQNQGALFVALLQQIGEFLPSLGEHPRLASLGKIYENYCDTLSDLALGTQEVMQIRGIEGVVLHATPFLMFCSSVTAGWLLLQQAVVAHDCLEKLKHEHGIGDLDTTEFLKENPQARFYENKLITTQFFVEAVIPQYEGLMAAAKRRNYDPLDIVF